MYEIAPPAKSDLPSHYILFLIEVCKDMTTKFSVQWSILKAGSITRSNDALSTRYVYGLPKANVYGITPDYPIRDMSSLSTYGALLAVQTTCIVHVIVQQMSECERQSKACFSTVQLSACIPRKPLQTSVGLL